MSPIAVPGEMEQLRRELQACQHENWTLRRRVALKDGALDARGGDVEQLTEDLRKTREALHAESELKLGAMREVEVLLRAVKEERGVHDASRHVSMLQEKEHASIVKERDHLAAERNQLQAELQRLQARLSELDELRMVTEVTSNELIDARGRATSASARTEALANALKRLELERSELAEQLQLSAERESRLQQQLEQVERQEAGAARDATDAARHALEEAKEEIRSHEMSSEHMRKVIANMRKDLAAAQLRSSEMEAELSAFKTRYSELESSRLRSEAGRIQTADELSAVDARLQKVESERDHLLEHKAMLESAVDDLRVKVKGLETDIEQRQAIECHSSTVAARQKQRLLDSQNRQEQLEKELANANEEKALVLASMADTMAAGSDADMAVRNLTDKVSELAGALRERNNALEVQEAELVRLREFASDRDAMHRRAVDTEERLAIALAAMSAKEAALLEQQQEIERKDSRITKLVENAWVESGGEAKVLTERALVEESQDVIADLQDKVRMYEAEIKKRQQDSQILRNAAEKNAAKLKEAEEANANRAREIETLTAHNTMLAQALRKRHGPTPPGTGRAARALVADSALPRDTVITM